MTPFMRQIWIMSGIMVNSIFLGTILAVVGSMTKGHVPVTNPVTFTVEDASWLASAPLITLLLTLPMTSYAMDRFGRRPTFLVVQVPGILASILTSRARSAGMVIVSRFLSGITVNSSILSVILLGEFPTPSYRGVFLNLKCMALTIGSSSYHFLNFYLDWRTLSMISGLLCFISLIMVCTWPESPYFYVLRNRFEDAEKSFFWLRGRNVESLREYNAMVKAQKQRATNTVDVKSIKELVIVILSKFKRRDFIIPNVLVILSFMLMEACGRHTFPVFAVNIIADIVGDTSTSPIYLLFIDLISILGICVSCILVRLFNRRTLLFSSGLASALLLGAISLFLFLKSKGMLEKSNVWITIVLLGLYSFIINIGCLPVALSFLGEVFPLAHKAVGIITSGTISKICIAIALIAMPHSLANLKIHGAFALSALFILIPLVGLYFLLPETNNKTLQEIEDCYLKNNDKLKGDEEELKVIMTSKTDP